MDKLKGLAEDAPKFQELLHSIKEQTDDILQQVSGINKRVQAGELTVASGVSLLDVKYNSLLSYVTDIISIILYKVNGINIANSEPVTRTVEYRTVLEKLRPQEQKLKYQIDKVIQMSTDAAALSEANPLQFKPNIDNFGDSDDETNEDVEIQGTQKYVPPHIAAVKMEESYKKQADLEKARKQALAKSSIISELIEEASDKPVEYSQHSHFKTRTLKEQEERQQYEEEYFTRVRLSKKQKSLEKHALRKSELNTVANFGHLDIFHGDSSESAHKKQKRKSSKHYGSSKRRKFKK